jgi:hypothetical protein
MVPGVGPVIAAGAAALAAIGSGLAAGLITMGVEEQAAHDYEEHVRGGSVLLTALAPIDAQPQIAEALTAEGAKQITFAKETLDPQEEALAV